MRMRDKRIQKLTEENQRQSDRIVALQDEIKYFRFEIGRLNNVIAEQKKKIKSLEPEISVGDMVEYENMIGQKTRFIVTEVGESGRIYGVDLGGGVHDHESKYWKKTGQHFDILGMLKKMVEEK